jgi:hypothetical protein
VGALPRLPYGPCRPSDKGPSARPSRAAAKPLQRGGDGSGESEDEASGSEEAEASGSESSEADDDFVEGGRDQGKPKAQAKAPARYALTAECARLNCWSVCWLRLRCRAAVPGPHSCVGS